MDKNWYAVITAEVLYSKELSARQKLLCAVISNLSNEKGYCFASNKFFSEMLGCSISSIKRDLAMLEKKQFIGRIIKLNEKQEVEFRVLTPVSPMNLPQFTGEPTPQFTSEPYNNIYINNKDNNIPSISFSEIDRSEFDENYLELNNSYISDDEKEKSSAKKEKKHSNSVMECYRQCVHEFLENLRPRDQKTKDKWIDTIEKLHRIDKVPLETIFYIVRKARNDKFWSKNFLSLPKLRRKNKDGVKYIVVFNELFKHSQKIGRQTKEEIIKNAQGW